MNHLATFDLERKTVTSDLSYNCFFILESGNKFEHSKTYSENFDGFNPKSVETCFFRIWDAFMLSLSGVIENTESVLGSVRMERSITQEGVVWDVVNLPRLNIMSQMIKEE